MLRQKDRFCHFCPESVCLQQLSKHIFMSVRPIQVQTRVHFKSLQFLVVMLDNCVLSLLENEFSKTRTDLSRCVSE